MGYLLTNQHRSVKECRAVGLIMPGENASKVSEVLENVPGVPRLQLEQWVVNYPRVQKREYKAATMKAADPPH